jgi:glycosyltransferase involved in cell wall biosynthesis
MQLDSIALMICTYQRPEMFRTCVLSAAALDVPDGFDLHVVVADNNPTPQFDAYIGEILEQVPGSTAYAHASKKGYSSARNTALDLALATPCEVFAFIDDDLELHGDWLKGLIRSYAELRCDGVAGHIEGDTKGRAHGAVLLSVGMGNTSFKRDWVEATGLGLRFDPKYDITGYEDKAFTEAAIRAGRIIRHSDWVRAINHCRATDDLEDMRNRAAVAVAAARNQTVRLREEGKWAELGWTLLRSTHYGLKAAGLTLEAWSNAILGKTCRVNRLRIERGKEWHKLTAAFGGLFGEYTARQDIRRGR